MRKLRKQLRRARRAYETPAYPGDLAADILPAREVRRPWLFPAAVAGTLAAAAAVVIAFRTAVPEPVLPVVMVEPPQAADRGRPTPIWQQFPDRMPLSLPAAPLVPVTPPVTVSLTALNDLRQPYQELGPKLRQHLNWPGVVRPATPKIAPEIPNPAATQQAA